METFDVVVEPAGPRLTSMLLDAFKGEGVTVERSHVPLEESRDAGTVMAAASLTFSAATFVVQAADSASVHRAIDAVNERLKGRLSKRVTPRHRK